MHSKRILIFSTSAGLCHTTTCQAIKDLLKNFDVSILDVDFYALAGNLFVPWRRKEFTIPDVYNRFIQQKGNTGLVWKGACLLWFAFLKLRNRRISTEIDKLLRKSNPDLVISIIPLVNKILCKRISEFSRSLMLHTIVVDFCQPIRNVWIQSNKQIIYGWNDELIRQANISCVTPSNIVNIEGQLISPKIIKVNKIRNGKKLKVFFIWGGNGSVRIIKYARYLEETSADIEINYIVGNNKEIYGCLRKLIKKRNSKIHTFISDVNRIYNSADLIIGKPGPSVISESLFTNTPLLLELNRKTLVQERYNAKWASQAKVALLFKNGKELKEKLQRITYQPDCYDSLKRNTYCFSNNSHKIFRDSMIKALFYEK